MMRFASKIFNLLGVCILFGIQLKFAKCQIGDGTMDINDLDKCLQATTCVDEVFVESRVCYSFLGEKELQKAITLIKDGAIRANLAFLTSTIDGLRDEYCAFTKEEKRAAYDEILDSLLDMYASFCMSRRTKKECDNLENAMDCAFTLMEKFAAEGKCQISEDSAK